MLKNARIKFTFYIIIVIKQITRAGEGLNCGAQGIWRIQIKKLYFIFPKRTSNTTLVKLASKNIR